MPRQAQHRLAVAEWKGGEIRYAIVDGRALPALQRVDVQRDTRVEQGTQLPGNRVAQRFDVVDARYRGRHTMPVERLRQPLEEQSGGPVGAARVRHPLTTRLRRLPA